MVFPLYLAMTAAEFAKAAELPEHIAWMACHFSCYGTGLCNLPQTLPKNSMLIVNDRTPVCGHDPELITRQLLQLVEALNIGSILLDFQRAENPETAAIAGAITEQLPCPVATAQAYAKPLSGPVFLPPAPLHCPLEEYLRPWQGRELWLDAALDAESITLTPEGSRFAPLPAVTAPGPSFEEDSLHCHYRIVTQPQQAVFTLFRTEQSLQALLQEASTLGVTRAVGLYQELRGML